jgi:periplasmic protein TonB
MKLALSALLVLLALIGNAQNRLHDPHETTLDGIEIYSFPDVEAQFPGGNAELQKYIHLNLVVPEITDSIASIFPSGEQNYFQFIIDKTGKIRNIEIKRGGNWIEFREACIDLIEKMPLWEPARIGDEPVAIRTYLPIKLFID